MERRGRNTLIGLTLAPLGGILLNTAIHANQGYYIEQWTLVIIGAISLALSAKRGVLFYGYASLLPVLLMMYRQVSIGGSHSSLQYIPALGIVTVALLTLSPDSIFHYTFWALTVNGVTILIYNDIGKAGELWLLTSIVGLLAHHICTKFHQLQQAACKREQQYKIVLHKYENQRGLLDNLTKRTEALE